MSHGKCVNLHCRKEIARTFETSTFVIFYLINQLYCPKKLCYYPKKPCSTNPLPKLQSDGRPVSSSVGDDTLSADNVKSDPHPSNSPCLMKCLLQRLCSLIWPSKCSPASNTHPTAEKQPASEPASIPQADKVPTHSTASQPDGPKNDRAKEGPASSRPRQYKPQGANASSGPTRCKPPSWSASFGPRNEKRVSEVFANPDVRTRQMDYCVRRFICLGAALLPLVEAVPACLPPLPLGPPWFPLFRKFCQELSFITCSINNK